MIDINKPVFNPNLVSSIKELCENYTKESERSFFKELMDANFLAPVNIDLTPEHNVGKVVLRENTKMQFIGISNGKGESFFPAFTDWNELKKWNEKLNQQAMILKFKDYERMILEKDDTSWSGFVINPYGENIVIDKQQMNKVNINTIIEKNESVILGIPSEYPTEMIEAIKEYLPKISSVKSAYLMLMIRKETDKSYLIVVDTDDNHNYVFEQISNVTKKFLKIDEKIDFVPYSNSFGKNAVKGQQPFYQQ